MRRTIKIAGALALCLLAVAGASAKPQGLEPMHGYPRPGPIEWTAIPGAPAKMLFAGAAELLHIGPVRISSGPTICPRMPPCFTVLNVWAGGVPAASLRPIHLLHPLVVDEAGSRVSRSRAFARLWLDVDTKALLVEEAAPPASMPREIEIVNGTGEPWRAVHMTASTVRQWGEDAADGTVETGESLSLPFAGRDCLYDIRLDSGQAGQKQFLMGLDVCATPKIVVTADMGQRVTDDE